MSYNPGKHIKKNLKKYLKDIKFIYVEFGGREVKHLVTLPKNWLRS
jgi:hypothetical protein